MHVSFWDLDTLIHTKMNTSGQSISPNPNVVLKSPNKAQKEVRLPKHTIINYEFYISHVNCILLLIEFLNEIIILNSILLLYVHQ